MTQSGDEASPGLEARNEESFRALYNRYYRRVFLFFTRVGFSTEESQDLVQDTFIRVYRGLGSFRGDASFETWLSNIAANIYRNERRRLRSAKRSAAETSIDALMKGEDAPTQPEADQGFDA